MPGDKKKVRWRNNKLITVWKDPDFDGNESDFYDAQVLEIPTPR
jgi:hypothetical protein